MLAACEWRARWRSQVLLVLVLITTVGATVACLTAADRSQTAFTRLRHATNASDVQVTTDGAGVAAGLRAKGIAEQVGRSSTMFVTPDARTYFPDYTIYPVVSPVGGAHPLDAALVVQGRAVDPRRIDEVALSRSMADALRVGIGDHFVLHSLTDRWIEASYTGKDPGPADGPSVKVTVVGIMRSPADFSRYEGMIYLSPAYYRRYRGAVRTYDFVYARLDESARRQLKAGHPPDVGQEEVNPSAFADDDATDDGLGTLAAALRLVAFVIALAGGAALMVTMSRLAALALRDRATLRALGWTRRDLDGALVLLLAPGLVAGLLLGVLVGVIAAPHALSGLARRAEPHPGAVSLIGGVIIPVVLVGPLVLVAMVVLAARVARGPGAVVRSRPTGNVVQLRRPIGLVVGVRHALFGESAQGGRTSRTALLAVVAGVAVAVSALLVSSSIGRLQTDPYLTGAGSNRLVDSGEATDVYDRALPRLERDPRVSMLAGIHVVFDINAGATQLAALAYDVRRGDIHASIVEGRLASQPDEVMFGPATLEHLRKHVGDTVDLSGPKGRGRYTITAAVLFPEGDFSHDEGLALPASAVSRLAGDPYRSGQIHQVIFEWKPDVDALQADRSLGREGLEVRTNDTGQKPAVVANLDGVRSFPRFISIFVTLLFLVTLGYAITVDVHLRRREIGTLRALGVTRAGGAGMVVSHSMTIGLLGALVGLPFGFVLGRQIWSAIAQRAHVIARTVVPWPTIVGLIAMVLVGAVLVAARPAWRAIHLQPTESLRTE